MRAGLHLIVIVIHLDRIGHGYGPASTDDVVKPDAAHRARVLDHRPLEQALEVEEVPAQGRPHPGRAGLEGSQADGALARIAPPQRTKTRLDRCG